MQILVRNSDMMKMIAAARLLLSKSRVTNVRQVLWLAFVIMALATATSACSGSPIAPSIPDCQYYRTGTLVLVNLAETFNPRDVYVDGRFIGVVQYQNQIALTAAAGVIHTVEWVSSLTGRTVDSIRLVVDECSAATVTDLY